MRKILFIISLIITGVSVYAQAPKYSNEFLSIGVGARALGMGNTVVSSTNDVTSGYWNPAGLSNITNDRQLALMHSEYFAGIAKYDYAGLSARIDQLGTAALSVIRFGVDDIPNTTELIDKDGQIDYNRISTFSAADYGFLFSYSRRSNIKGLRFGANAKVVHRKVGDFGKAWGFGLDAGMQYEYNKWKFGVMGRDITSTFNAWSYSLTDKMKEVFEATKNEMPKNSVEVTLPKLLMGMSRTIDISKKITSTFALDFDCTFDGKRNVLVKGDPISIDPHFGLELGYSNFIFIRGGIMNIQEETDIDNKKTRTFQPNIGIGLNIKNLISIDYALSDIGNQSIAPYSNIFSLKINLNRRPAQSSPSL